MKHIRTVFEVALALFVIYALGFVLAYVLVTLGFWWSLLIGVACFVAFVALCCVVAAGAGKDMTDVVGEPFDACALPPRGTPLHDLALRSAARRADVQPLSDREKSRLDDRRASFTTRAPKGFIVLVPGGTSYRSVRDPVVGLDQQVQAGRAWTQPPKAS